MESHSARTTDPKRWVYSELVRDKSDFLGVVAYGMYKFRKNELAQGYAQKGKSEAEIKAELVRFHDQTLLGGELERYRASAASIIDDIIKNSVRAEKDRYSKEVQQMRATHAASIQSAKETHEKAILKAQKLAVNEFVKSVNSNRAAKPSPVIRFLLWLGSGLPSAGATTAMGVLVLIVLMLFVPSDRASTGVATVVNTVAGQDLVTPLKKPAAEQK